MTEEIQKEVAENQENEDPDAQVNDSNVAQESSEENKAEGPPESAQTQLEQNPSETEMSAKASGINHEYTNIDLLLDISLQITVELGRKEMAFGEVLKLGKGSIIELNKLAEEPVEIFVNQRKIAQGEVVVVDEHFGVRITRLEDPSERVKEVD
jgi:flagellar motor switch protein FliN/FliY